MHPTRTAFLCRLASGLRPAIGAAILLFGGAAQAQPTVTALTPARNALSVPRTTPVAVSFNQPLSTTPATQQALRVFSQQAGGQKSGTATVSGNTLSFQPATAFKPGETVSATLTTGVQSSGGQALAQPQVFQFTTATAPSAGTFRSVSGVPLSTYSSYNSTAMGDIDGDGDLDFATDEGIQLNNGTGGFSPGPQPGLGGTVLGDVDNDGDLDLLNFYLSGRNLDSNVRVFLNGGTGTFSSGQVFTIGRHAQRLALGDVDADGDLDLVTVHVLSGLTADIYINNGAGVFSGGSSVPVDTPYRIALGDVDNDGDLDLATVGSVRLNNGRGVFSGGFEIGMPGEPKFGDIDNDGDLDLLTAGGTVSVYVNNGLGAFSSSQQIAANSYDMAVCDVDGDGDLDLLTLVNNSAILTVYLNNGTGVFSAGQLVALDARVSNNGIAIGDLNGDNTLDLLAPNEGVISVRLNQLLPPASTTRRLNAGGPALSATNGQFVADQYFSVASATATTTAAIAGTEDDALYQSERYSTDGQLRYAVPVANGAYSVVLHFAETYWTQPGQRVFNIGLEGNTVRTNFDIVAKAGPLTATTETFTVQVTDGVLNLDLVVPYLSGGRDQAKLSALEILPVTAVARLNVGSNSALSTSRGIFAADTYYQNTGGTLLTTAPITGTEDDALYQSERYSTLGQLSYVLSVPNGTYTVTLHFAEIYWTQPGQRVFNIGLEGTTVRTNYDIVAEVGPLTATTETFTVQVADGQLNVDLRVPYGTGGADQAKLSALEVYSGGANGSNRLLTNLVANGMAAGAVRARPVAALELYPNPSQGSFMLGVVSAKAQAGTLVLTDRLGRVIREQRVTLQTGRNQLQLQYPDVREGLYQLTLRTADGQRLHQVADIRW